MFAPYRARAGISCQLIQLSSFRAWMSSSDCLRRGHGRSSHCTARARACSSFSPPRRCRERASTHQAKATLPEANTPEATALGAAAARLLQHAKSTFELGDMATCQSLCKDVLRKAPSCADAYDLLARVSAVGGDAPGALTLFDAAADVDAAHWQSRLQVAECVVVHQVAEGEAALSLARQRATEAVGVLVRATAERHAAAAAKAALLRLHWLLSRIAQALHNDSGAAAAHLAEAARLAHRWLDPPTSRLPRVTSAAKTAAKAPRTALPGLPRPVRVERLAACPLLLRVGGLVLPSECERVTSLAKPPPSMAFHGLPR